MTADQPAPSPRDTHRACGCTDVRDHAEPHADSVLHIEHGERDVTMGDPPPYAVPGGGHWNGLYTEIPDAYCLCGHPNYLTCKAWANGGGVMGLTVHDVGGYVTTTLPEVEP